MYSFVLLCYNECMNNNNNTNLPCWDVSYFGNGDGTAQVFWAYVRDDQELANVVSITDDRWYVMVNGEEICEVNSLEEGKTLAVQLIG